MSCLKLVRSILVKADYSFVSLSSKLFRSTITIFSSQHQERPSFSYLSWLPPPPLLLLRRRLPDPVRPDARFSSELLSSSSSTSLATLRRSLVDCVMPIDDRRRCSRVIDCGAVCRSFFVDADVDLMYDGTSSVGDVFRMSAEEGRSGTDFFPETAARRENSDFKASSFGEHFASTKH